MPSKTLLAYIQTELAKGVSEASIRTQCLSAGWHQTMVDEAFAFLQSVQDSPGSAKALALEKKSRLIPLIRIGFGLLFVTYLFKLLSIASVVVIMQRAVSSAVQGTLTSEFLTYNGWFFPTMLALTFVASYLSLKIYFSIPQRTNSVWKKAMLTLIFILLIELVTQYLAIQYALPINDLSNSY